MISAVIFDLDGLLVDSTPLQNEANRIFLERHGKLHLAKSGREGMRIIDIIQEYKDIYDLPETIENLYIERQEIYFDLVKKHLELFGGAFELLEKLKKRNLKIALATSGDRNYLTVLFEKFPKLKSYFSVIVSSEDVIAGKPNPEVYQKALEKLEINPQKAVVLEDSINGILAAKGAGIEVICIPNQNYPEADYSMADKVFNNLFDVAAKIV